MDLNITNTGCSSIDGYRLFRSEGSGSYIFLKDLGGSLSYTDSTAVDGNTYNYKVSTYNADNSESGLSSPAAVTVSDTTAPAIPLALVLTPGDGLSLSEWDDGWASDIRGYNVYMSIGAGGPYTKQNSSLVPAGVDVMYLQNGLTNNTTYYFVVTAVDFAGNESSNSVEESVVPNP